MAPDNESSSLTSILHGDKKFQGFTITLTWLWLCFNYYGSVLVIMALFWWLSHCFG